MKNKNWRIWSRFFHKWMSVILGIQIFLWFLSGTVMSYLSIDSVHGKHLFKEAEFKTFKSNELFDFSGINYKGEIRSIDIKNRDGHPVYLVHTPLKTQIYDGMTGKLLNSLTLNEATKSVEDKLTVSSQPVSSKLLTKKSREFKGELPVWKIDYSIPEEFSVYVSPLTGEILSVRNTPWRIFDFFWMLHIMDYKDRENINSIWLVTLACASTIFAVTGLLLLFAVFFRRNTSRQYQ